MFDFIEYKLKKIKSNVDVIDINSIIRKNLIQKIKTAARASNTEFFWLAIEEYKPDLNWDPPLEQRQLIHVFGSDLNHIQAIFANKSLVRQLDSFKDFILHDIPNIETKQNIIEIDELITKEMLVEIQQKQETEWFWVVNTYFDYSEIDFTWREDPWNNPKLYAYGNKEHGNKAYLLHKKTDVYGEVELREHFFKRIYDVIDTNIVPRKTLLQKLKMAARISSQDYFYITNDGFEIDNQWMPEPHEREYIHLFGSDLNHIQAIYANKNKVKQIDEFKDFKLHEIHNVNFNRDILETEETITKELLVNIQETQTSEWLWVINKHYDYSDIDFTWRENPWDDPKLYVYGNKEQGYKAYLLHKKTDIYGKTEYYDHKFKRSFELIDAAAVSRKTLLQKLKAAARISKQEYIWVCHKDHVIDPYWEPAAGEENFIHFFGKDLNHIQAISFNKDSVKDLNKIENFKLHETISANYNPIIELTKIIERSDIKELQTNMTDEWLWIIESYYDYSDFDFTWRPDPWNDYNWYNFGNRIYLIHQHANLDNPYDLINMTFKRVTLPIIKIDTLQNDNGIAYSNYTNAIKQAITESPYSLFWLSANHIDTSKFDFTWFPEYSDIEYIHCWGTGNQDKGDVFLINKTSINKDADDIFHMAEIKFHNENLPAVNYGITYENTDNLPELIQNTKFDLPWHYVVNTESKLNPNWPWPQPCYWYGPRIETYGDNNSIILYHKDVIKEIKTEIYDFPTIIKNRRIASFDKPLDVIFLSSDEYYAHDNFQHLKNICPRAKHVSGIKGRANSYKAMAEASDTQWFFAVFAKLNVNKDFDFDWKPDRLQAPKHYIFKSTNSVNGLEYGHMAIVAANKNIILKQTDYELDFTLGGAHTVVDINSGIAHFNESPLATWRTAFRECVKLTYNIQINSLDLESFDRLNVWLNQADGHYADYCLLGAKDGFEYAKRNEGNLDALKLTREWDWLNQYFTDLHSRPLP